MGHKIEMILPAYFESMCWWFSCVLMLIHGEIEDDSISTEGDDDVAEEVVGGCI